MKSGVSIDLFDQEINEGVLSRPNDKKVLKKLGKKNGKAKTRKDQKKYYYFQDMGEEPEKKEIKKILKKSKTEKYTINNNLKENKDSKKKSINFDIFELNGMKNQLQKNSFRPNSSRDFDQIFNLQKKPTPNLSERQINHPYSAPKNFSSEKPVSQAISQFDDIFNQFENRQKSESVKQNGNQTLKTNSQSMFNLPSRDIFGSTFKKKIGPGNNFVHPPEKKNWQSDFRNNRSHTVKEMKDEDLLGLDFANEGKNMEKKYNYLDQVDETLEDSLLTPRGRMLLDNPNQKKGDNLQLKNRGQGMNTNADFLF